MLEFIKKLFRGESSGATARERLRLVLLSDHLALAPDVVESLKNDLFDVISKYVEIDRAHCDVTFEQREREVAMLANIPILGMKARPPSAQPPEPPTSEHGSGPPVLDPAPLSATLAVEPERASEPEVAPPKPRRRRRRRPATLALPAPG